MEGSARRASQSLALLGIVAFAVGSAPALLAAKPEAAVEVRLRVIAADEMRGRYRLEARIRSRLSLDEASFIVQVHRGAMAERLGTAAVRPLSLRAGQEVRREVAVEALPHESVTILIGVSGRIGTARLHRAESVDLGPPSQRELEGRVRIDREGRAYFEVPMRGRGDRR